MILTGIKGLDSVITGLQLGDNVVWQIDSIEDYAYFVAPFVRQALEDKRRIVYIRFAGHKPLLEKRDRAIVYKLDPSAGFETFSAQINDIIRKEGEGVFYVFDCLSDLLSAWSNDLMIGNFFKITCPFLYELNTVTYFALLRNSHSFKTVARIRDTTQLLIDAYKHNGKYYIHPLKVWNRYSSTMFLPHMEKGGRFVPIASSIDTARIFSKIMNKEAKSAERYLDYWERLFIKATDLEKKKNSNETRKRMLDQLCRIMIARDDKILRLAKIYLDLNDILDIKSRMIGTGFVGGKSVGMLVARNILSKDNTINTEKLFEPHDSFYVGSDVFYTYIVENGWWKARMEQKTKDGYFESAKALGEKLLQGSFPEEIKEQFRQMLEYFGQSPIIVRSSSLLEDSYGNAFAGKYESIFLVNQGTPEERYAKFVDAVRRIYASTMNEDALTYRLQRGLGQADEQMALLVQRVSGAYHGKFFFPDIAGVGISYNTFVWKNTMDPKAGMLRLVVGLGTRAVNRVEGDYPRIVALDEPLLKAHANIDDTKRFSQHEVDVLNISKNSIETVPFNELLKEGVAIKLDLIAEQEGNRWVITFDPLVSDPGFRETMQKILKILEDAYGYPVDTEFTINFKEDGPFQINILQCRPVQTKGLGRRVAIPEKIAKNKIILRSSGNFLGGNISQEIRRIIYVDPKTYADLATQSERYDIARAVGTINRGSNNKEKPTTMLLGPGRWGTTTPSLGVPVSFAEINNMTVLVEIAFSSANATPELSFGTHFFQDLVETGIFYLALFPGNKNTYINQAYFDKMPNLLKNIAPQYKKYSHVIKVFDMKGSNLRIVADIVSQDLVCYIA